MPRRLDHLTAGSSGFSFAIDPTDEQLAIIARFFGARRKAYNWALEQIKAGIDAYHATAESKRPSLYGLRKRWNATSRPSA